MTLSEPDNGRTIDIGAGEVVTVRLKENPTTGYRWTVESAGGLVPAGDQYEGGGGAMGAAGVRVLQFHSSGPGSHELRLKNRREWEGDSSITERFNVTIVAK
jgi:inhibitor of cysteine peptidase